MFSEIFSVIWNEREIAGEVKQALRFRTAPNAGDDSDAALFAKMGLTALRGEEPMRVCKVVEEME